MVAVSVDIASLSETLPRWEYQKAEGIQVAHEGFYRATLTEVLEQFGTGTQPRRLVGQRLERLYTLAVSTGQVLRFAVFGSFVTAKPLGWGDLLANQEVAHRFEHSFNPRHAFAQVSNLTANVADVPA